MRSSVSSIVLCGGKGERSGSLVNKVLCYFGAKTALEYCLDVLAPLSDEVVVVAAAPDRERISEIAALYGAKVVTGGDTRTESVKNGLAAICGEGVVLIHDAARPFLDSGTAVRCIESAVRYGSGICAVPVVDSVKTVSGEVITGEVDRNGLCFVQTPQVFVASEIKRAYEKASGSFTDDSAVYAAAGFEPRIVLGRSDNKKITYPEDLISTPPCQKIGIGVDFHRLVEGRKLIVGGVEIPFEKGLLGHSDADVLCHAVMDAVLSASDLPDIGVLFPGTDEFKGADSIALLKKVAAMSSEKGFGAVSVSATIMAKAPKMQGHIAKMRANLASAMGISPECVNVSATTTEGLGIIGSGDGMASSAVALLFRK